MGEKLSEKVVRNNGENRERKEREAELEMPWDSRGRVGKNWENKTEKVE